MKSHNKKIPICSKEIQVTYADFSKNVVLQEISEGELVYHTLSQDKYSNLEIRYKHLLDRYNALLDCIVQLSKKDECHFSNHDIHRFI